MEEDHRRGLGLRCWRVPQLAGLVRRATLRCACVLTVPQHVERMGLTRCCSPCLRSEHHHMHTPPAFPYLRIRNKPLPWGDGTKDLLDVRHEYVDDHDDHHH